MRHTRKGTQTPLLFLVRDMPFGGPGGPSSGAWWSTTLVCVHCTREHRLCAMRPSEMADVGAREGVSGTGSRGRCLHRRTRGSQRAPAGRARAQRLIFTS